jgi:ABC-2 type transport system ATP-binding protein
MISAEKLTRTYGEFTAVDDISFGIARGEIVGLLGHNGAGKTTIMKMLTGFLEPTAGSITVDGLDIGENREAVQSRIGYLPENCPVYPEMNIMDYLDYAASLHGVPAGDRPARISRAVARTELGDKAGSAIQTLSRGYQQRVGVAQAILHEPSILILDEPTNGLDPTQIQQMRGLIRELSKSATIIISTHILQEVQAVCDRVIVIHEGRLALDSRLDDLRSGSRLLLEADGDAAGTEKLLAGLERIRSVDRLGGHAGRSAFALLPEEGVDPTDVAPAVARAAVEGGLNLYSLRTEGRDLESIFSEISAGGGRAAG